MVVSATEIFLRPSNPVTLPPPVQPVPILHPLQPQYHFGLPTAQANHEEMRFNFPFPRRGGGWGRRYWRVVSDMQRHHFMNDWFHPWDPLQLFDFLDPDDAADAAVVDERDLDGWRISDDGVIGGYSESRAKFIPGAIGLAQLSPETGQPQPSAHPRQTADTAEESNEDALDGELVDLKARGRYLPTKPPERPYIRWEGHVDTAVGLDSDVHRSGFAALRSPVFPFSGANLRQEYEALEVMCRSDGRVYTVNLTLDTYIGHGYNIFRGHIQSPPRESGFDTLYLPFSEFHCGGMSLDGRVQIESIGFTLMDGQDGPFQFDLARIRAVNFFDGRVHEAKLT